MTPNEVASLFVEAINTKRVDGIFELMTPNHVYIEPDGEEVKGRERMHEAWAEYFKIVPDYRIEVEEVFTRDNTVVFLGTAAGTFTKDGALNPEYHWSVPAAWRAVVKSEQIAVWQLYVNIEPIRRIMKRLGAA
ncbi:MAG: hypothetical protein GTO42_01085 [Candidatus Latescibacteria bacterium]|nr:hypothetical protein [Candidatus Latescibacterota bacterium]NIO27123.1 hypothetical protein [Candidatus Latescibacterota bacterium]NIO54647.1 hypothetical protein [Candidatus Latescibacterota bacterium]NIT00730.1 hypothetical protein [Candidatus Latescibacterota bacterium]NIT37653.1 hypothetical protein [Candidatus Latescibacterota bacterium]